MVKSWTNEEAERVVGTRETPFLLDSLETRTPPSGSARQDNAYSRFAGIFFKAHTGFEPVPPP